MSVINKMLKDLESEQNLEVSERGNILVSKSNSNLVIIIGVLVIFIVFILYFYTNLFSQKPNQNLTQDIIAEKQPTIEKNEIVKANEEPSKPVKLENKKPDLAIGNKITNSDSLNKTVVERSTVEPPKPTKNLQQETNNHPLKVENKALDNKNNNSNKVFKITKSKISSTQQAQRFWSEAEQHPQNAELLLIKALGLDASLHGARLQLIALFVTQNRLSEAEQLTDRGLILSPQHPGYIEWKARMRVAFNDAKTGLQWLLKASPKIEQHINYYGILATLASQLKYNEIASETYLKLSTIQPKHGPWLLGMAISEERLGNNETAKNYYQKAQSADGLTPRARIFIQQKLNKLES